MSDPIDPSLLSYPSLPPLTTENALIDFDSPATTSNDTSQFFPTSTTEHEATSQHNALHSFYTTQPPSVPAAPGPADTQSLRLQHLEQLCSKMTREKYETQEEFGKQRKKFMDKIIQMESERNLLANMNERYGREIRELSTVLLDKEEQLNDIAIAAKMSDKQAREDFDADRVKYEEEMASMRQIMNVQTQEQGAAFNQERESWRRDRDNLLTEIQRLRSPHGGTRYQQPSMSLPVRHIETTPTMTTPSQSTDNENLEFEMAKASMDAQVLKSVVVPLEIEIEKLKDKLSRAEEELSQAPPTVSPAPPLIDLSPSSTDNDAVAQLQHQLNLEKSARQDLEMHTDALVQQKTITHQEILVLTQEMGKYKDKYRSVNGEHTALKTEYDALKTTWELANQHFLASQERMKEQIATLQQAAHSNETNRTKGVPTSPSSGMSALNGGPIVSMSLTTRPSPRSHRRSQSSEGDDIITPPSSTQLQRRMSSSLPSLEQISDSSSGSNGDLEQRLAKLTQENVSLREQLGRKTKACSGYESQLHRVQNQMLEEMDQKERNIDRLRGEVDKLRAGVMRERETQKQLRRTTQEEMELIKNKMNQFGESEKNLFTEVRKRKDNFTELKHDTQTEIARLSTERIELRSQLESSREEYDCLKVLQSQQMAEYQQSISTEKAGRKEAEINVQMIMSQLSTVQSRLQSTEEDLCSQLSLVQQQLHTESHQKEALTAELTSQLTKSMTENMGLQSLKADIESEKRAKEDALNSKVSIQEKSTAFIQEQQREIQKLHKDKESKEKHIGELTRQMSSLKHQLDKTAETQKDFVELSQSLQMKIVAMEENQQSSFDDSTS